MGDLRRKLGGLPGFKAYPQIPPAIRIGGQLTKALYQFTLFGSDLKELYTVAAGLEARFRELPQLVDANSDLQVTSPQLRVDIQRDRADTLGWHGRVTKEGAASRCELTVGTAAAADTVVCRPGGT